MYQLLFLFPYTLVINTSIYLYLIKRFAIGYMNCNFINLYMFLISKLTFQNDIIYNINCNYNEKIIIELLHKFFNQFKLEKIIDIHSFEELLNEWI